MKMYCSNMSCDFEYENNPTVSVPQICPKCGGTWFCSIKEWRPESHTLKTYVYRARKRLGYETVEQMMFQLGREDAGGILQSSRQFPKL